MTVLVAFKAPIAHNAYNFEFYIFKLYMRIQFKFLELYTNTAGLIKAWGNRRAFLQHNLSAPIPVRTFRND